MFAIPLLGDPLGNLWNTWAADLSVMAESFRPYFGMMAEAGFSLVLGIANGVVGFVLALFIAFFFYTVRRADLAATAGRAAADRRGRRPTG